MRLAAAPTSLNSVQPEAEKSRRGGPLESAVPATLVLGWYFLPSLLLLPAAGQINSWLVLRGWDVPDAHFTTYFLYDVIDTAVAIALAVIGARVCKLSKEDLGWRFPSSRIWFVWAIALVIPALGAVYALDVLPDMVFFQRLPSLRWNFDPAWGAWANPTVYHRFFTRALSFPVSEELLYRGLTQGVLRRRHGPAAAVIATALLFAILHPYRGAWNFAGKFLSGLLFCCLREKSGSIAPPMLAHFAWNQWASVVQFHPMF